MYARARVCVLLSGGLGLNMLDETLVGEELAYGCTGISTAIGTNMLAVSDILYMITSVDLCFTCMYIHGELNMHMIKVETL